MFQPHTCCFIKEGLPTVTQALRLTPPNEVHARHTHLPFFLPLTHGLRDTCILSLEKEI